MTNNNNDNMFSEGNEEVLKVLLLHQGVAINKALDDGTTPLLVACVEGYLGIVNLLLSHPLIDVDSVALDGAFPLFMAAQMGFADIVEALVSDSRCNITRVKSTDGSTALFIAVINRFLGIVELLLSSPDIDKILNLPTIHGITPLAVAAWNGDVDMVKLLITYNAKVDPISTDNGGDGDGDGDDDGHGIVISGSPLFMAARNGHMEVVKTLLNEGADVNFANQEGCTPLRAAYEHGHFEIAEYLQSKGARLPPVPPSSCEVEEDTTHTHNHGDDKTAFV